MYFGGSSFAASPFGDPGGVSVFVVLSGNRVNVSTNTVGISASARASLGIYNSKDDIDALSNAIKKCNKVFNT